MEERGVWSKGAGPTLYVESSQWWLPRDWQSRVQLQGPEMPSFASEESKVTKVFSFFFLFERKQESGFDVKLPNF